MNEVRRVTDAQGEMFATLFGMTPQMEGFVKYLGGEELLQNNCRGQRISLTN